jgi:hypothetical protein
MKKSSLKTIVPIVCMLVLTSIGYSIFYNNAFSGYEARGAHIWLSASTVKFVNNWLNEGPVNLNFIMYEYPASIEFNSLAERGAYISYPPGSIVPVYILAKLLHKPEIQIGFIKQFLKIKFLFDTLLVCLIFYSILTVLLKNKNLNMSAATSVVFALSWMLIPINLYYLRNVYFSDQCIITVVLLFTLLEIYTDYFSKKTISAGLYLCFKFLISVYGVLTDYYFLFVLFVSWLAKIIPLFTGRKGIKSVFAASLVYVLPVLSGIGLFMAQISTVPNYKEILFGKMKYRMLDSSDWHGNKIIGIIQNFVNNYSVIGLAVMVSFFVLVVFFVLKRDDRKLFSEKYPQMTSLFLIVCLPPVFQVLVLQQHSAIHEFSMLKFGLPFVFSVLILTLMIMESKNCLSANIVIDMENNAVIKKCNIPIFYFSIITVLIVLTTYMNQNKNYFYSRIGNAISYEREYLIRDNYNFNDVYFSFTESIEANPPQYLAISKKLIYKIDDVSEIANRFQHIASNARFLLLVNKNNSEKSEAVLHNENKSIKNAQLVFFSENFNVYIVDPFSIH